MKILSTKKSQAFSDKRVRFANFKHKIFLENCTNQSNSTKANVLALDTNHTKKASPNEAAPRSKKSLLFLNHGLKRNDITKIKTSLGKYNIKLTKIPVRILSSFKAAQHLAPSTPATPVTSATSQTKAIVPEKKERQVKQKMYGEMFLLYATNSSYGNQCLDFLHQQLLYFLLQKATHATLGRNLTYQKLLTNAASNNFPNANIIYNNIFSIETANEILPWDLLAVKPITCTVSTVGQEWTKDNAVSLFLNYVNDSSLTFTGCLSTAYPLNKHKIYVVNDNMALYHDFAHLSYSDLQKVLLWNCIMAIEPYNLSYSPFNLSFLYHL